MMEGRILSTKHGSFSQDGWDGINRSGITPLCDNVLVKVDKAVSMIGMIEIPADVVDRQHLASTTGIMVAVGPQAFVYNSNRSARWEGDRPYAGLRVVFQRYAGQEYTGIDGELYRVMDDFAVAGSMGEAGAPPVYVSPLALAIDTAAMGLPGVKGD